MKEENIVSYTWDTLPPLTDQDRAELAALPDCLPEGSVDDPDNPVITPERWAKRVRNSFAKACRESMEEVEV